MSRKPKQAPRKHPIDRRVISDFLPPEGVPIRFEVASIGARFGAQLLDILLTGLIVLTLFVLLIMSGILSIEITIAISALLFFALRVPYYVVAELLWNGQTLGKRITGLRVISGDGRSLSAYAVTIRNMMKEMEVFVPGVYLLAAPALDGWTQLILLVWVVILLFVPLRSKRNRRLGDIIANTYVVNLPRSVLLPDLARTIAQNKVSSEFTFLPHHLDHYGRYELQTLETLLQVNMNKLDPAARDRHVKTIFKVASTIANRIEFNEVIPEAKTRRFLESFYHTQRAYLENRKLFGDAREDKFHKTDA